jgi:hypothetical protein
MIPHLGSIPTGSRYARKSRRRRTLPLRVERLERRELLSVSTALDPAAAPLGLDAADVQADVLTEPVLSADLPPYTVVPLEFAVAGTPVADPHRNLVYVADATNR